MSMTEVLVATVIAVIGVLPAMTLFLQSGSSIRQTQPYYQSLFLAELAVEEARLGSEEDPHYLDRLTPSDLSSGRWSVVRCEHPYLSALEDSATPFGRMEKGTDLSLEPRVGPLFDQAEPLGLTVSSTIDPARREATVRTSFDWIDQRGHSSAYSIATPILFWQSLSRVDVKGAGAGGGVAQVLAIGDAARLARGGLAGRLAALNGRPLPSGSHARAFRMLEISIEQERTTAELLGLLQALRPCVEALAAGGRNGAGMAPVDAIKDTLELFYKTMAETIYTCVAAANETGQPMSILLGAQRRLLRVAKMDSLTRGWALSTLSPYLAALEEHYRGRMPNVMHFFAVEAQDVATFPAKYTLKDAAQDVRAIRESFTMAALNCLL
ncbi:MAG: hypothetical protein HY815_10940 [Candidatus Riflebacteria bacterium]|nr:hypothetical protein [Candidatus Riflebacteria bacterium]